MSSALWPGLCLVCCLCLVWCASAYPFGALFNMLRILTVSVVCPHPNLWFPLATWQRRQWPIAVLSAPPWPRRWPKAPWRRQFKFGLSGPVVLDLDGFAMLGLIRITLWCTAELNYNPSSFTCLGSFHLFLNMCVDYGI